MKIVKLEKDAFDIKNFEAQKATFMASAGIGDAAPDSDGAPVCMRDVKKIVSGLYDHMYSMFRDVYGAAMQRDDNIVSCINSTLEDHSGGHLPPMHPGQVKAVLTAAGIHDEFEHLKTPVAAGVNHIYASIDDSRAKLNTLKVDVE